LLVSWQSEGEEILLTVQGSHFEVIMSGECTHTASLGILAPVFGDTYHRAQAANSKEEFIKSKDGGEVYVIEVVSFLAI
jgi:hypothetical protein